MARFVDFINSADEKLANELVSPNAIFHVPGRPEPITGPAGYMAIVAMMRAGFSDIQWTLEEAVAEENKIAAHFTMYGTHTGPFMGVPSTQKTIHVQALNIYQLENGKIVKEYGQPDLLGLLMQLGAFPS
ncbi:MAG: ester cyclase [Mesorhizobium sp.]|nr:MAG: ester cyclase [Mesorhizobium sp.]